MKKLDVYLASASLLLAGIYLKSSIVCIAGITLWVLTVAENIFTKAAKDAEIMALTARAEAYEKKLKALEADVMNVAERAKTILGETY